MGNTIKNTTAAKIVQAAMSAYGMAGAGGLASTSTYPLLLAAAVGGSAPYPVDLLDVSASAALSFNAFLAIQIMAQVGEGRGRGKEACTHFTTILVRTLKPQHNSSTNLKTLK